MTIDWFGVVIWADLPSDDDVIVACFLLYFVGRRPPVRSCSAQTSCFPARTIAAADETDYLPDPPTFATYIASFAANFATASLSSATATANFVTINPSSASLWATVTTIATAAVMHHQYHWYQVIVVITRIVLLLLLLVGSFIIGYFTAFGGDWSAQTNYYYYYYLNWQCFD